VEKEGLRVLAEGRRYVGCASKLKQLVELVDVHGDARRGRLGSRWRGRSCRHGRHRRLWLLALLANLSRRVECKARAHTGGTLLLHRGSGMSIEPAMKSSAGYSSSNMRQSAGRKHVKRCHGMT